MKYKNKLMGLPGPGVFIDFSQFHFPNGLRFIEN
jgi:hypothetical protein